MTLWEIKWGAVLNSDFESLFSDENVLLRKTELETIFYKYLSKQALEKGQSRLVNLSFQNPPAHNVEITKTENNKNVFSIYVKENYSGHESRFNLIEEDEKLKIDSKAYSSENWKTQRTIF
jgi:hypothetical protein